VGDGRERSRAPAAAEQQPARRQAGARRRRNKCKEEIRAPRCGSGHQGQIRAWTAGLLHRRHGRGGATEVRCEGEGKMKRREVGPCLHLPCVRASHLWRWGGGVATWGWRCGVVRFPPVPLRRGATWGTGGLLPFPELSSTERNLGNIFFILWSTQTKCVMIKMCHICTSCVLKGLCPTKVSMIHRYYLASKHTLYLCA
jgi:hypothetical protein